MYFKCLKLVFLGSGSMHGSFDSYHCYACAITRMEMATRTFGPSNTRILHHVLCKFHYSVNHSSNFLIYLKGVLGVHPKHFTYVVIVA